MALAAVTGPSRQSSPGTELYAGRVRSVEESPEFSGDRWWGTPSRRGFAQVMACDSHVRRCDMSYSAPIRRATLGMDPGARDARAVEAASFAEWALFERVAWDQFVRQSLTDWQFGSAVFEVLDDVEELPRGKFPLHPGGGRGVVFTAFHHLPRWSIDRWEPSASNPTQLAAVVQHAPLYSERGAKPPRIDAARILRFTFDQEGGNFDGFPLWRSCAADVLVKRTLRIIKAIWHERAGVGLPTITLPENATPADEERADEILAELRAHEKGFLRLPNGFVFEWKQGGATTNLDEAIAYCDRSINFCFGANFLDLGSPGTGPGSYALSSTLDGHHELSVEARAIERLSALARGSDGWSPLRRLIDLNYGPDVALPVPVLRDLPTHDWSSAMPVIGTLVAQGIIRNDHSLRAHVRRAMKLPTEDDGAGGRIDPDPAQPAPTQEPAPTTAPAPGGTP